MNVRCPSCETLYRVDPAKVPAEGVRASCATCGAVFLVSQRTSADQLTRPAETGLAAAEGTAAGTKMASEVAEPIEASPAETAAPEALEAHTEPTDGVATGSSAPIGPASPAELEVVAPVFEISDEVEEAVSSEASAEPNVIAFPLERESADKPVEAAADMPDVPDLPGEGEETDGAIAEEEPEAVAVTGLDPEATQPTPAIDPASVSEREAVAKPRFSRPFMPPGGDSVAEPAATRSSPMRPSAPVFRPTPGMPVRTPPFPVAPQETGAPVIHTKPDIVPAQPIETSQAASVKRPVNPFLSKDPKQKARRLARALVSDMIVYQPKKRQDALEAGNLKDIFDEEIKKSWEEYVQQVGEDLANSTDFFTEALNDILAGGRQVF